MTLLCSGASLVEWTPDQSQDCRVTLCLQQKTQDSFVQTSPRPCTHFFVSTSIVCSIARMHLKNLWQIAVRSSDEGLRIFSIFLFTLLMVMSGFLSCDKCTYCWSLWTKASAKCPKCKCRCKCICKLKMTHDCPSNAIGDMIIFKFYRQQLCLFKICSIASIPWRRSDTESPTNCCIKSH